MTRAEKIAEAQRLRDEGLTLREIAERMGLPGVSSAWKLVNSERDRAQNLSRNDAKRATERGVAGRCQQCGGGKSAKRAALCDGCEKENRHVGRLERMRRFIRLREAGLLNYQIAERCGTTSASVATLLYRAARDEGLAVPPSPYHR